MSQTAKSPTPPVLIVGVHRSGTSLLTRMLERIGLFVGKDLQGDHESGTFIQLNNLFFEKTDSSWDKPAYPSAKQIDANIMGGFFRKNYEVIQQNFGPTDGLWGFKDPRTVTTLPLWKRLFPSAPIVYITRSPHDIARSLTTRHNQLIEKNIFPASGEFTKGRVRFTQRCATLDGSLAFAVEQFEFIEQLQDQGLMAPCLQLSYEGLLHDPVWELARLTRFLGLEPDRRSVLEAADMPSGTDMIAPATVIDSYFPTMAV